MKSAQRKSCSGHRRAAHRATRRRCRSARRYSITRMTLRVRGSTMTRRALITA
jgi:hypothetical protein